MSDSDNLTSKLNSISGLETQIFVSLFQQLNLDLVQFPAPVFITELRIIPLGAKVKADFPGGSFRLGATNPSQFQIEFFVNDLSKSGASTFECLGGFLYNQNECIHMECSNRNDEIVRRIPTDGLVLKGCYTTITLAVYGNLTRSLNEANIASPQENPQPSVNINNNNNSNAILHSNNSNEIINDWNPNVAKNDTPEVYNNFPDNQYDYTPQQRPQPLPQDLLETDPTVSSTIADDLKDDVVPNNDSSPTTIEYRGRYSPGKDQNKREWSNSPEYRVSKRSRLSSYENNHFEERSPTRRRGGGVASGEHDRHRKPRTPPLQSPRISRPRSPTDSEDDFKSRSKDQLLETTENDSIVEQSSVHHPHHHHHRHGEEDLSTTFCPSSPSINNNTPIESPLPMDEEASEPFEPILSDDDISDEDPMGEIDELANEQLTEEFQQKIFNPFMCELKIYKDSTSESVVTKNMKSKKIYENLLRLSTFCNENYLKGNSESESVETLEISEDWVNFCEELIQTLMQVKEECAFEKNVLETCLKCVKIGLNYKVAFKHQRPGYNLRHIKVGLRLIEHLCCYPNVLNYFVNESQFHVFEHLMELFLLQLIPLPIKLLIMRQVYLIIDTKEGLDHILDVNRSNGYNRIISLLKQVTDTRLMFVMKSILKKIHLYETLESIRKCTLEFYQNRNLTEILSDLECLFKQLIDTLNCDEILFTQPKRFLPIIAQFEVARDATRKKDFVVYYKIHKFLETLIVLLEVRHLLTATLFGLILDSIKIMIANPEEFNYICENIELLNIITKLLLQSNGEEENNSSVLAVTNDTCENIDVGTQIAYKVSFSTFKFPLFL